MRERASYTGLDENETSIIALLAPPQGAWASACTAATTVVSQWLAGSAADIGSNALERHRLCELGASGTLAHAALVGLLLRMVTGAVRLLLVEFLAAAACASDVRTITLASAASKDILAGRMMTTCRCRGRRQQHSSKQTAASRAVLSHHGAAGY